ncbi:MAG: DUF58 domain-containing protein [Betaproteobacteria bacterium]|nr:DUF58 domain-containing protein [Betaproteobacteria bacterium]
MSQARSLFNEDFLRRLEHLNIVTRRPVAGHLRGSHRSRRQGTGMVFADYRPYTPGDDTRNLDWGTYIRLDRLILRLFEEEADLPVYVFVDASASMNHGMPSKFDFARQIGAALGYLALLNYDRVSIVAWSQGIAAELPVRRGRSQVWPMFKFLEGVAPAGGTDLGIALRSYFGARRTRGLVVLISDFLDRGGFTESAQWLSQFRHEVAAIQVLSPEEMAPELPDQVVLVDDETGAAVTLEATPELLEAYRGALSEHCSGIENTCRRFGWSYLTARSDAPFEDLMLTALRREGVLR